MKKLGKKSAALFKRFAKYMDDTLRTASQADPCWIYSGPLTSYVCMM